jgi:hypothetical protein
MGLKMTNIEPDDGKKPADKRVTQIVAEGSAMCEAD